MQKNAEVHGIQPTVGRKFKMAKGIICMQLLQKLWVEWGVLKVVISRCLEKRENRKGYPVVTSHSTPPQTPAMAGSWDSCGLLQTTHRWISPPHNCCISLWTHANWLLLKDAVGRGNEYTSWKGDCDTKCWDGINSSLQRDQALPCPPALQAQGPPSTIPLHQLQCLAEPSMHQKLTLLPSSIFPPLVRCIGSEENQQVSELTGSGCFLTQQRRAVSQVSSSYTLMYRSFYYLLSSITTVTVFYKKVPKATKEFSKKFDQSELLFQLRSSFSSVHHFIAHCILATVNTLLTISPCRLQDAHIPITLFKILSREKKILNTLA